MTIVLGGAAFALTRPWLGILLWTWISIMNPHRYAWTFAYSAPIGTIAAVATGIGLLFTSHRQSPFQGAPVWWLLALSVWITLSWLIGLDPAGDYPMWDRVIKVYLMTFVALALLITRHHILAFAIVTAGSIGLLAVKGGIFTVLTGGEHRVYGPAGSFIEENNAMALATIIAIPLLRFIQLRLRKGWQRHLMTAAMLLCGVSALGSHSRGGLIALVAMVGFFWFRNRSKVLTACVILIAGAAFLPLMPEQWWDRMETITSYEEDVSAMGRINAWHVAWHTARTRFFGGGMSYQYPFLFAQYGPYEQTGLARAAHSIYFQILGNHGFVGLFLFLGMWISAYRTAGWLRKNCRDIPEARWAADLGAMCQVSFVGFAAGGAFLSLSYFDLPYNLMVMVVLARRWVLCEAWKDETAPATLLQFFGLRALNPTRSFRSDEVHGRHARLAAPRERNAEARGD